LARKFKRECVAVDDKQLIKSQTRRRSLTAALNRDVGE
jgi:hypothetical protein